MERKGRNYLYGTEVASIHASANFTIRRPIRYGNLNVKGASYSTSMAAEDVQRILEAAFLEKLGLAADKLSYFNIVIVIADTFVRHHVRYLLNILFVKMRFRAAFIHLDSVMATYAMAAQTAVVVDIGGSKTTVCCIDDGVILNKSVIKKHYGGDDISELLFRLIRS